MEVLHPALHQLLPELAIVPQLNLPGGGWDMLPWMDDTTPHTDLLVEHVEPSLIVACKEWGSAKWCWASNLLMQC